MDRLAQSPFGLEFYDDTGRVHVIQALADTEDVTALLNAAPVCSLALASNASIFGRSGLFFKTGNTNSPLDDWTGVWLDRQTATRNVTAWQTVSPGVNISAVWGAEFLVTAQYGMTTEQYQLSALHNGTLCALHGPFDVQRIGTRAIPGVEFRAMFVTGRMVLQARAAVPVNFHAQVTGVTRY